MKASASLGWREAQGKSVTAAKLQLLGVCLRQPGRLPPQPQPGAAPGRIGGPDDLRGLFQPSWFCESVIIKARNQYYLHLLPVNYG